MNSIEDKKIALKRTLKILYSNAVTQFTQFSIIDSKFVSQNAFHYYKKFKKRKKSKKKKKNTITNIILYMHTFSNSITNHFHHIYIGHGFPYLSSKC